MKWFRAALLPFMLLASGLFAIGQKPGLKYGKPRTEDFALTGVPFDSGANAIVIADVGSTSFEGNSHGSFNMVFTRFMRVKILNKNGFDIATQHLTIYHSLNIEEKIKELKGVTYNLENGTISETKLEPSAIFDEKVTKDTKLKKFTLPGLKEGSVFDLTYTISSDFFVFMRDWHFQGAYPRLWSEYTVTIPPCFHYVTMSVGNPAYEINESKDIFQTFSVRENNGVSSDDIYSVSGKSVQHRWGMKEIPAVHEEKFLATTDNYSPAVRFQLHYFQWSAQSERHDVMGDWFMASKKLLEDEDFGKALNSDNHWMNAEMNLVLGNAKTDEQKLRQIYDYLRTRVTCTSYSGIYAKSSLKEVFRQKTGTAVEINLLLTALLRHEGISADPVLLSTRDNGVAEQAYPLMSQFDYVICNAVIGGQNYRLDASRPMLGFNKLPVDCYNGQARMINLERPYLINLYADSVTEARMTSVFISNAEKGALVASLTEVLGDANSYSLREELKKGSRDQYFKKVQTSFESMGEVKPEGIDSVDQYDKPITVRYDVELKKEEADLIYFNPILADRYNANPFTAAKRRYPVEMPYCIDETYILNMEMPAGYAADEVPKSARIMLNENEGYFEYLVQKDADRIQMRVRLKLKKANFQVEDYNTLRDFYANVVKKESEQIVFRKIK